MAKIYFAGPLFTWGEREQNARIVAALRSAGHEVFLPQEHEQKLASAKQIFDSDMDGLYWATVIVACMDQADPDSGTCFEVGAAYGSKRIVLYRTDIREEKAPLGPFNLMMHARADETLACQWMTPERIAVEIVDAFKRLMIS